MKSFIYAKIRFIGVLFLLILFNSITVFAAGNEEYFRSVFDPDYYYNQYPDLQEQLGNDSEALFHHFVTIGVREGRLGNAEFNLRAYVLHNRDLLDYYKTDLAAYCKHYMEIGKAEGRTCLPTGDEQNLIGTYSTHYDTTVPRAVNIGIAVERLYSRDSFFLTVRRCYREYRNMDTLWRLRSAAMNTAVVSVRYRPLFMLPCVMPCSQL